MLVCSSLLTSELLSLVNWLGVEKCILMVSCRMIPPVSKFEQYASSSNRQWAHAVLAGVELVALVVAAHGGSGGTVACIFGAAHGRSFA